MDKNTLTGLALMGLIIFGFMWLNRGQAAKEEAARQEQTATEQARAKQQAQQALTVDTITAAEAASAPAILRAVGASNADSIKEPSPATPYRYSNANVALSYDGANVSGTVKGVDTVMTYADVANTRFGDDLSLDNRQALVANLRSALQEADRYRSFARYLNGTPSTVTLKNDVVALDITNHGAYISRATLLKYKTYLPKEGDENVIDTADVNVFREGQNTFSFLLTSASQRFDTKEFFFNPSQPNDSTVVMTLDLGSGASWSLRYTLPKGSYVARLDIIQQHMDRVIPSSVATTDLLWHQKMGRNEQGRTYEERNSGIFYKFLGDSPDDLGGDGSKSKELSQRLRWISFKNQFFSAVMIPRQPFTAASLKSENLKDSPTFVKDLDAKATMPYSSAEANPVSIDLYIGPNSYPLLSKLSKDLRPAGDDESLELTRLIPLGWSWVRWINTLIIIPVFTFLSSFISSYGLIIFLLTIFIKIILFPFTYKSYLSQAKMRVLAPEIKEINDKYPGQENAMTRNQKTMALYSRAGASPFSGCLPLLLQMPVLIAMFWFFPSAIELRGHGFLWAHDLAAPDYICTLPFTIPWYGSHVSLFCLLMTVTNFFYTKVNMQNQPNSSSMPGMKMMQYLMPLMFLFFFNDYASGLSYYYFLSLLITIIQTYIFRYCIDEKKVRARMMAAAAKPKKKSGFMARLEAAQRRQQAILRDQQKKK